MIGRIFLANQPTVRSLSDTVICFVSMLLWDSFEQKESQPSVTRYWHSRHVQCISLPQYDTGIFSRSRQSAFLPKPPEEAYNARHLVVLSTPQDGFQHKPSGHLQWLPQKLPGEGTGVSTVQKGKPSKTRHPNLLQQAIEAASRVRHPAFLDTPLKKTSGVRYSTFPSKLPQASPTSYPVFLDTSSCPQRYGQKNSVA